MLYSDKYNSAYKTLSKLFCDAGNPNKALYVEELGRGRALSDLMAAQKSVERQISADPRSWTGIKNVINLYQVTLPVCTFHTMLKIYYCGFLNQVESLN